MTGSAGGVSVMETGASEASGPPLTDSSATTDSFPEPSEPVTETPPGCAFFAAELRKARHDRKMTQDQLAQAIKYSTSLVAMVERGRRLPSSDFTARVDTALESGGLFERIRTDLIVRQLGTPAWFQPWRQIEAKANSLLSFQPLVVPGLLQTEGYARALLRRAYKPDDDERTNHAVAARLARQQLLVGKDAPDLIAVIDERVLSCPVGGRAVMAEQLTRLVQVNTDDRGTVQILPMDTEVHLGLAGAFSIASLDDGEFVYLDNPVRGQVLAEPHVVTDLKRRWNAIRSEALSRNQSTKMIRKAAEQWAI